MFDRAKFIAVATAEAMLHLVWTGPNCPASKYTKPFAGVFGSGRFSWCAAFVTWCLNNSGCTTGIRPNPPVPGMENYTWALVELWQQWAKHHGFWHHNDGIYKPQAGDLIIFDWNGGPAIPDASWDDHIGVCLGVDPSGFIKTAEGNTSNMTALKLRSPIYINGYISIPEGFKF